MHRFMAWLLPLSWPVVVLWARRQQARILKHGSGLDAEGLAIARAVGVARPERIRVLRVDHVPIPFARLAAALARRLGLPGPDVDGMTLGHGIYLRGPRA